MSLWTIAWRSIRQRGLASLLTAASMALGITLVVTVLAIYGILSQSFQRNSSFGYNMIVGAKGGSLQLTLNSVYYLSDPIENIPYDYFLEFFPTSKRDRQYENSLQRQAFDTNWDSRVAGALAGRGQGGGGLATLAECLVADAIEQTSAKRWDYSGFFVQRPGRPPVTALEVGRETRYGAFVDLAIPLCLGDYLDRFRVIGTVPEMFEELRYGDNRDRTYAFRQGRNFKAWSAEHSYFEAVIGATVARELGLRVRDTIAPSHGAQEGQSHAREFTVVGILKPTGTPQDRAVFVNMEGFFLMEDHAKPVEVGDRGDEPSALATAVVSDETLTPLPVEQREVTAVLVNTRQASHAIFMENLIDEGNVAQAVLPVEEIFRLFSVLVRPLQGVLLGLTVMICVVSGVSIMVSIYNSMNERRHEIAVMRALGAGRDTVMTVILLEAIILALLGGVSGWLAAHALSAALSPLIESYTGVSIGFFDVAPATIDLGALLGANGNLTLMISPELLIVPGLIVLAVLVGFAPAAVAYRTDVAASLGK